MTSASHAGIVYSESGDAGQLTSTAQLISGSGSLTAVRGSLLNSATTDRADIFAVFFTAGTMFSATTTESSLAYNNFDTTLYLFDGAGLGLLASDDEIGSQSSLFGFTPTLSGLYYLAISGAGYNPFSAGGLIFPSLLGGGQFGATGPGSAQALSGWSSTTFEGGDYEIVLAGASAVPVVSAVPEPTSWLLAAFALTTCGLSRRNSLQKPR